MNEVDIDLDEVLDIEDEDLQKRFIRVSILLKTLDSLLNNYFIQNVLTESKSSKEVINVSFDLFIEKVFLYFLIFRNLSMICLREQRHCDDC